MGAATRLPTPFPRAAEAPDRRCFLAFSPPEAIRQELARLAEPLPGVRWVRPDQLHVTLRFLGPQPEARIQALVERLAAVQVASFLLPLEGLGGFPLGREPHTVWVGTGAGHPHLFQLRKRVDDTLLAAGLDLDLRAFHPHLTLGRVAADGGGGAALKPWLKRHREYAGPAFRVGSFELWSSQLAAGGPVYGLIHRFPLA